jgi:MFS transporter, SP family, galactose:H+ symporter
MTTVICPLYVSEMAQSDRRGLLGSVFQVFITFGIFVAYLSGYFLAQMPDYTVSWRIAFGLGAVPPGILFFAALVFIPESDKWLSKQDAEHATQRLLNPDAMDRVDYASDGLTPAPSTADSKGGWSGLFSRHHGLKILLGIVLSASVQLTGINALIMYMPSIFENAGFEKTLSPILTIVGGAANFVATFPALLLVDRLGRRPLLLSGLMLMLVSMATVAGIMIRGDMTATLAWVVFGAILAFQVGFELSPGTLFWIILGEVFPSSVRDQANSLVNVVNWIFNVIIVFFYPPLASAVGVGYSLLIFSIVNILVLIVLFFMYKETKGVQLD